MEITAKIQTIGVTARIGSLPGMRADVGTPAAIAEEKDPTVPAWAKQPNKPEYGYEEIREAPREFTNMEIEQLFSQIGGL